MANSKKKAPFGAFFLVDDEVILLASESRKEGAVAVATLGYNLVNTNLWSRIAQNCLFHNLKSHSIGKFKKVFVAGERFIIVQLGDDRGIEGSTDEDKDGLNIYHIYCKLH